MQRIARGGISGIAATALMSLIIAAGRALGMLHTPPPQQITANVQKESGVDPSSLSRQSFHASWVAAHVAYGAGAGSVYALLRSAFPENRKVAGLAYGGLVWAASYLGLMPALGLYPWPEEDNPSRVTVMIAAHAVYGLSLAEIEGRLARR